MHVVSVGDWTLAWPENLGQGGFGERHVITAEALTSKAYCATDLDGDHQVDVLTGREASVHMAWYRNPCGDLDLDALSDDAEVCITRTDPAAWDTDGGGVPDGEELLVLTHPLDGADDSSAPDLDGDGVPDDAGIHWLRTDAALVDTDGGGAPDGSEYAARTDPVDRV